LGWNGKSPLAGAMGMASNQDVEERLTAALADRYRIQAEIGSGGMATVYLAQDLRHNREVAVKVMDPELAQALGAERFLREIETAANLHHPHILPLYDSGEAGGLLFYVMPYVKGESLRTRLTKERQLSVEDAIQITRDIADALAYAHEEGVIHRDVKPANILIESGHAALADFGVAHAVTQAKDDRLTKAGISLGTPAYMSPEQAAGERELDGRSDQYALGCVLFEMLSGEPPFTGPTPVAILARQVSERLPSLAVVRPNLPPQLVEAVEKALAKVPADRYPTTSEFLSAIVQGATGDHSFARPRVARRRWLAWASVPVVVALAIGAWFLKGPKPEPLDENLLVVFPLDVSGQLTPDETGRGEDNAYVIWNALEGRGSLGWLNAMHLVDDPEEASRMSARERRALAQAHGSGFYLHGRLMLFGDSARAYLTLHEVARDSVVMRADTAAPRTEASLLGVRAVGKLLLVLLPEETVNLSALAGRDAEAVQTFVQAERHFFAGRFQQAFDYYREAVGQDSAFALAAVKGAQAASWLHRAEDATDLIGVALDHEESLTPRRYHFARGLEAFFAARADSAVHHFEEAIAIDEEWPEAWTGLGEVYTHLLPRRSPQDSLAKDAFIRVYEGTNHSAPALFHLVEFAIRDGDLRHASELMKEFRAANPDTVGYATAKLELMFQCAESSSSGIDWRDHVLRDVPHVLEAARSLGVGGAYPHCATAGFRAVLAYDTSGAGASRYAASVGLQSMLAATGRVDELIALMDTTSRYRNNLRPHYILDALAGVPVDAQAEVEAERLRSEINDLSDWEIWYLGVWDAHRDRLDEARVLRDTLIDQSVRTGQRRTNLVAASLRAHVVLSEGDTALAIRLLDGLTPSARRGSLYYAWESLGFERLLLARLLLARGRYSEAYREASAFDSPGAANLIYPLFLPASLEIRLEAARELGDQPAIERIESRFSAFGR